jgi:hypothetical protein
MAIWRMRMAWWIHKATNTDSQYGILVAYPLQQWLHERASMLRCTYIPCLVVTAVSLEMSRVAVDRFTAY